MKDIDFDELDRAVSSILGKSTEKRTEEVTVDQSPAAVAAKTGVPEYASEKAQTSVAPVQPEAEEKKQAASPPSTPLAIKRRGRFMDVMHPAAQKTSETTSTRNTHSPLVVPVPAKSSTDTDEPSTDASAEAVTPPSQVEHLSEPTAALDESSALIGAEPAPMDTSPDLKPEDTASLEAEQTDTEPALSDDLSTESPEVSDSVTEDTLDTTEDDAAIEMPVAGKPPLQPSTPFLAEAKVDKRPLGGFPGQEDATPGNDDDTQKAPEIALPRELQPDVMNVETALESQNPSASLSSAIPAYATPVKAAPEHLEDGRVEGHPLFDTSTYHEPIAAVHKRSMPTWLKWLAGLLLCLGVGAGVGYFLFTAGL